MSNLTLAEKLLCHQRREMWCFDSTNRWNYLRGTPQREQVKWAFIHRRRWIEPGRVFDRVIGLAAVPDGYRAMNEREAIKVMVKPLRVRN